MDNFVSCFCRPGKEFDTGNTTGFVFKVMNFTYELRDEHKAEANPVVAASRAAGVAISRTTILPIVVPATTAQHTVRTHD